LDDDDSTELNYKYTYDGFGNLVKVEKPDAAMIDYTYNKLNQMTREYFDANNFNDYEYCCCSLIKHQQTVARSQLDPFELTLDKLHRLTKEQYPDAGNPKTQYFEYKYDNAGRRIEMTDPTYGRAAGEPTLSGLVLLSHLYQLHQKMIAGAGLSRETSQLPISSITNFVLVLLTI